MILSLYSTTGIYPLINQYVMVCCVKVCTSLKLHLRAAGKSQAINSG